MKSQTVQQGVRMVTPGQMKDIISAVVQAIPTNLSFEEAERLIGKKKKLGVEIKKIFISAPTTPYAALIADWEQFYRDLGINCDLSGVAIPNDPGGFGRVIIMIKGVTPQGAYDLCAKNFPCWKWTDENLDRIVRSNRTAKKGPYAIRLRDRVEADEELKNLSANDLKRQGVAGITLEEREIYELKFFKETGKHLDVMNWTLCAGSRGDDGDVPNVDWRGGQMSVRWCGPGVPRDGLRSRAAVC